MRRRSNTLTHDNDYPVMSQSDKFCTCSTHGDAISAGPADVFLLLLLVTQSHDTGNHSVEGEKAQDSPVSSYESYLCKQAVYAVSCEEKLK